MSQFCRAKVRSTFRRRPKLPGNHTPAISYRDPRMIWILSRNWKRAQAKIPATPNNAVMKEKAS